MPGTFINLIYLLSLLGRLNQIVWLLSDMYEVDDLQLCNQRENKGENFLALEKLKTPFQIVAEFKISPNSRKQGVERTLGYPLQRIG